MGYASLTPDRIVYIMMGVNAHHANQGIIYRLRAYAKGLFPVVWSPIKIRVDASHAMKD